VLACREALALSEDLALTRIYVTSDCSSVVSDIREGSLGLFLKSDHCSFVYEGRASNFEAHNLAKSALSCDVDRHVWLLAPYSDHIHVNIISV
jgi:hypothetical protein